MAEGYCALGIGGIVYFYLIGRIREYVRFVATQTGYYLSNASLDEISFRIPTEQDTMIVAVSIILLLTCPLLIQEKRKAGYMLGLLFVLIVVNMVGLITSFGTGEINSFVGKSIWMLFSYFIWLFIQFLKIVYNWLLIDEKKKKIDVAKMTLIWTIIAFLLGVISSQGDVAI